MDVLISGIPMRFWAELRRPVRKRVEAYLEEVGAPYGDEVRVHFYPVYDQFGPLKIAFDATPGVLSYRAVVMLELAEVLFAHSRRDENEWWYQGFRHAWPSEK